MNLAGLWDQLVDAVCRPPRDDSYSEADLVGGRRAAFRLYNKKFYRQDVELVNSRSQKLQCSHYRPCVTTSRDGRLPCVIYLHCNSGSRRDAEEILYHLLPKGITVFAFDFAGSGLSQGGYVTLGALEVEDLMAVVQYLREEGSTSTIGLWGRSMGAVTALLFSQQDPSVAGMVLDSPFSRLVDLMLELATDQQLRIPKPLIKMALAMLKRSVRKRASFSVDKVAPLDCVGQSFIPALFGHARDDSFVGKHHSERLFQAYAGDKNFISFEGDHNSVRPDFFYDSALIFLLQALRVDELVGPPDLDLAALPEDALPHLHSRGSSIYVTASRDMGYELAGAEADAGSGASSPRSPRSPGGSGRMLMPPWALPGHAGAAARGAAAAPQPPTAGAGQQPPQQQQAQSAAGALQADGPPDPGGLAAEVQGLHISEEEALQRALELSLQDARQQQQGGRGGGHERAAEQALVVAGPGSAGQQERKGGTAAGPLPHGMRYNAAFASSGERNTLYGGSSAADVPSDTGDEEVMLAVAIAASLRDQQQAAAGAGAAATDHEAGAGSPADVAQNSGGSSNGTAELAYYLGKTVPRADAAAGSAAYACAATAKAGAGPGTAAAPAGSNAPPGHASSVAAQAVADAHAGQEAAAARAPSLQLQHALSEAMDAMGAGQAASGARSADNTQHQAQA